MYWPALARAAARGAAGEEYHRTELPVRETPRVEGQDAGATQAKGVDRLYIVCIFDRASKPKLERGQVRSPV